MQTARQSQQEMGFTAEEHLLENIHLVIKTNEIRRSKCP